MIFYCKVQVQLPVYYRAQFDLYTHLLTYLVTGESSLRNLVQQIPYIEYII